ncbi:MAG: ABC transporter permease [Bacteroidetes bacterium]|nr:ABC transporter permease [Bacteroidota bacterium]
MPTAHTIINAEKKGIDLNLKEIFHYKDLFFTLAYRDFRIRYAQTFLGFLWAFIQPLGTLFIFVLVFGKAIKVETGNVPYAVFAFCGMVAWSYFSFVLSQSGSSLISSQDMIKKIYFPRIIIPISKSLVGIVDFLISFVLLIFLFVFYGYSPSANIIFLPIFVMLTLITSLGTGIWLSALTIRYRDFQHVIPFLVQLGLYITPIAYPAELVSAELAPWAKIIYYANPMAGIVEGFRWSLLGSNALSNLNYLSFALSFLIFITSIFYFRKTEKIMADII